MLREASYLLCHAFLFAGFLAKGTLASPFTSFEYDNDIIAERSSQSGPTVLVPVVHPAIDPGDLSHLKAKSTANLYYGQQKETVPASVVAIPNTQYPIVRLEHTSYVDSLACSDTSATVKFVTQTAFQTAAADWKQQAPFVLVSYSPSCGSGHSAGVRDYVLVDSISSDPSSKTITAAITHVDFATAVGASNPINLQIGTSVPPPSHKKAKRSVSGITSGGLAAERSIQPRLSGSKSATFSFSNFQTITLFQQGALTVQCAGCGGAGTLTLVGSLTFTISNGLTAANIGLSGNMQATVAVGLVANSLSKTIKIASQELAAIPIAGIVIPKIASIGPEIKIAAGADVTVAATGSLTAGANLNWPSIQANIDAVAHTATASGFVPSLSPIEQISGTVSATLNLHLPVTLGIGIDLLNGKFNKTADLTDTPTFSLKGSKSINTGTCKGVEITGSLNNKVDANLFNVASIALGDSDAELFKKCLGGQATSTKSAGPTPTPASPGKRDSFARLYDSF